MNASFPSTQNVEPVEAGTGVLEWRFDSSPDVASLRDSPDAGRMELDLVGQHAHRAYPILASLVTPRPIAWVTTIGPDGTVNAAPFSCSVTMIRPA